MKLKNSHQTIHDIVKFINRIASESGRDKLVVAVSGGIDSAVSLKLAVKAVGQSNVFLILLPYGDQDMSLARLSVDSSGFESSQITEIDIKPIVELVTGQVGENLGQHRLGNVMARTRMILIYDLAKKLDALVCGTENKSEKYLGYFTRFGDEASDIEPIVHLYKTQVREIAPLLEVPQKIIEAEPSAGLWQGQTDEGELGFSYEQADQILHEIVDRKPSLLEKVSQPRNDAQFAEAVGLVNFLIRGQVEEQVARKILERVRDQAFKRLVPYQVIKL